MLVAGKVIWHFLVEQILSIQIPLMMCCDEHLTNTVLKHYSRTCHTIKRCEQRLSDSPIKTPHCLKLSSPALSFPCEDPLMERTSTHLCEPLELLDDSAALHSEITICFWETLEDPLSILTSSLIQVVVFTLWCDKLFACNSKLCKDLYNICCPRGEICLGHHIVCNISAKQIKINTNTFIYQLHMQCPKLFFFPGKMLWTANDATMR